MAERELQREPAERPIAQAEVVARVTGGVVHSFNNILAVLQGRVEVMLGQVDAGKLDPAELRRGLLSVQKVTRDATELLKRLRDLTQSPPGGGLASVDLNRVVLEAIERTEAQMASAAGAPGIAVRLVPNLSASPLAVSGQSSALREVFANLLLKAVEALGAGGEVGIETRRDGAWAVVQLSGVGGSDAARAWTVPPFTARGAGGSGSGLSGARDVIAWHGGSMTVETRAGRGTIVTIVLPGIDGGPALSTAEPAVPLGLTVLVVEDDPAFRELLKEFLEARGCNVALAAGGAAALDELVRRHFDVVITDLVLPGASGWDVARAAKTAAPGTAVIVMSGDLSPADQRAAGHLADAALTKPIDLVTLSRVIADVAGRASV